MNSSTKNRKRPRNRVGSGEFVRLRSLTFVCVAQAGMALVMGAIGTVDSDTIIPACYFSFSTFVGAWLMRDKPNNPVTDAEATP
jgi:hypothetical protein